MRFLLDQDVYAGTATHLLSLGHDVIRVAEIGLSRSSDEELLITAGRMERLFVTRDRDFGNLVFVKALGAGVLYLRMLPSSQTDVHNQLALLLNHYSEQDLSRAFVVVERDRYRVRWVTDTSSE